MEILSREFAVALMMMTGRFVSTTASVFGGKVLAISITTSGEPVKEGSRVSLLRQWQSILKETAEHWGNHLPVRKTIHTTEGTRKLIMSQERISETAETEKIADSIVEIWREILSRDDIARDTHFLDLGGDSLDAMRTALRIEQRFGTEFTLEEFFTDSATAMGQAKQILKNRVL